MKRAESPYFTSTLGFIAFHSGVFAVMDVNLSILLSINGFNSTEIGQLFSVYNFVGIFAMLLVGRLFDRYPLFRAAMIFCVAIAYGAFVGLALASSWWLSVAVMALFAMAYLACITTFEAALVFRIDDPELYGKAKGFFGIAIASYWLLIESLNLFNPPSNTAYFTVGGLVSVLSILGSLLFLSDGKLKFPKHEEGAEGARPESSKQLNLEQKMELREQRTGLEILGWPLVILLFTIAFAWNLLDSIRFSFFPLYVREVVGSDRISLLFSFASIGEVPVFLFAGRFLRGRTLGMVIVIALLAQVLRFVIIALFPVYSVLSIVQLLVHPLAYCFYWLGFAGLINKYFTKYKGLAIGVFSCLRPFVLSLTAGLSGIIIDKLGYQALFLLYCAVSLLVLYPIFRLRLRYFQV